MGPRSAAAARRDLGKRACGDGLPPQAGSSEGCGVGCHNVIHITVKHSLSFFAWSVRFDKGIVLWKYVRKCHHIPLFTNGNYVPTEINLIVFVSFDASYDVHIQMTPYG